MKILNFELDTDLLQVNQNSLIDTMKLAVYDANLELFEQISFENDLAFSEPALFFYFLGKDLCETSLDHILLGHQKQGHSKSIKVKSDTDSIVSIPNLGYFKLPVSQPNSLIELEYIGDKFRVDNYDVTVSNFPNVRGININVGIPFILSNENMVMQLHESIEETIQKNITELNNAFHILEDLDNDFYNMCRFVTREIFMFSSSNRYSMAAINHHGTAFINTCHQKQNEIFFLEDLAHQCGHIIFFVLTLQTQQYLIPPKEARLIDIFSNNEEWGKFSEFQDDVRTVYDAFHGLFTYSTILHIYDKLVAKYWIEYNDNQQLEIKARMGFYMKKFEIDVNMMNRIDIFTPKGYSYWESFHENFITIKKKYQSYYNSFTYQNQPYMFDFEEFKKENKK